MSDKHTLSIDQAEWRVLFAANIERVTAFVHANGELTAEHLTAMLDHLDRAKLLARSWHLASPAVPAKPEPDAINAVTPAPATPAPRKGGWPKGRKRNGAQAAVQ